MRETFFGMLAHHIPTNTESLLKYLSGYNLPPITCVCNTCLRPLSVSVWGIICLKKTDFPSLKKEKFLVLLGELYSPPVQGLRWQERKSKWGILCCSLAMLCSVQGDLTTVSKPTIREIIPHTLETNLSTAFSITWCLCMPMDNAQWCPHSSSDSVK